jgi:dolichol-phosphate mannosyltransferase
VPAYNEVGNLEAAVRDVVAAAADLDEYEVLVVDDGSTDGTGELADRLARELPGVRAIHHDRNRGFAATYRTGLEHARLAYYTFVPGDNEVTRDSIRDIFASVGRAEIVVPYHGTPWARTWDRRILTWVCTNQINLLMGRRLRYYQGPAVYPTALARSLPITTSGFFFATEMLIHALAAGYTWVEVPLRHQERTYGTSKAVGLGKVIGAELTILRLWWNVRIRRRGIPARLPVAPTESEPSIRATA